MPLPAENLLSREASPYLLQHKANPVHWRAWSDEALEEARALDRPILLSVGYAACHWCHVMAHESFEDAEVAAVMNRLYVNIKVDREERPDIDQIYMSALTATGEQGGWPLTMFLTPEGRPFWGGTYFPREQRLGRPGFVQVLEAVHKAWSEKKDDLAKSADTLTAHVQGRLSPPATPAALSVSRVRALADGIYDMVDHERGGLRGAPKFPSAPFMNVLWLNWLQNGEAKHRDAVVLGLRRMLAGGIYDHVGGGLARYSTDAEWLVPHFEKMLYDNAQLVRMAGWAHAATGDQMFRLRIEETIDWLLREMRLEGGAFASSLDADSEGEEGLFYLWTREEIETVLGAEADDFLSTFTLAQPSNWEGGPILHRLSHAGYQGAEPEARLRAELDRLRETREGRVRPGRDDKALVDWNGLAITAMAEAGRQFDRPDWIEAAGSAFHFVAESMEEGRLPHSILGEKRLFPALAGDYAAMINAAVSLHQATGDAALRKQAYAWLGALDAHHADETGSGHYMTASDSNDVLMRIRGDVDDAIPSPTSQIIEAMVRLSSLDGDHVLYDRALKIAEAALGRAMSQHYGQAGIVYATGLALQPMKLVTVEPSEGPAFVPLANRSPDPRRVDIVADGRAADDAGLLPQNANADLTRPGAWLCVGQSCLPPVHDPDELRKLLERPLPVP